MQRKFPSGLHCIRATSAFLVSKSDALSWKAPRRTALRRSWSALNLANLSFLVFVSGKHEFPVSVRSPLQTGFLKFLFCTESGHFSTSGHSVTVLIPICRCPASVAPLVSQLRFCGPPSTRVLGKASTRPGPGFCASPGGSRAGQIWESTAPPGGSAARAA